MVSDGTEGFVGLSALGKENSGESPCFGLSTDGIGGKVPTSFLFVVVDRRLGSEMNDSVTAGV